jgi:hypothetical protein
VGQRGHCKTRGLYIFSYGKGKENHPLGTEFLYTTEYFQQLKRVQCVSDRMSYIHF